MFHKKPSLVLAAAAFAALTTSASAQTTRHRHHHPQVVRYYVNERPPLTVNQRSFLDPGPVVPVGSMSNYVTTNTIFARTADQYFLKSQFGNEVLPAAARSSRPPAAHCRMVRLSLSFLRTPFENRRRVDRGGGKREHDRFKIEGWDHALSAGLCAASEPRGTADGAKRRSGRTMRSALAMSANS